MCQTCYQIETNIIKNSGMSRTVLFLFLLREEILCSGFRKKKAPLRLKVILNQTGSCNEVPSSVWILLPESHAAADEEISDQYATSMNHSPDVTFLAEGVVKVLQCSDNVKVITSIMFKIL